MANEKNKLDDETLEPTESKKEKRAKKKEEKKKEQNVIANEIMENSVVE